MNKAIYISTSIPYVNATPHIGYALEAVQGDALARYYREISGNDVFLSAGTDENAIKNVEAANQLGVAVKELVDKNSEAFESLKNTLNLSNDRFIRTSSDKHKKGAQKFWLSCRKEDIYSKNYEGLYCTGCETFYKEGEFKDNICPLHNRKLELVKEKNYFFKLSNYQDKLEKLIENDEIKIYPHYRKVELLNFLKKGLEDISISRPRERTKGWGVEVPGDDKQIMYVWFDALTNYITTLDYANEGELFKKFWLNNNDRYHIIGKDIIKFHALYWPAMLLSANLPRPTKLFVHGFINVEGKKMSKSIGNVINPNDIVSKYGTDAIRYYLLREIPSLDDGDYSELRMKEIYNSELADELGNLLSRLTTLAEKDTIVLEEQNETNIPTLDDYQFNKVIETHFLNTIKNLNKDINDEEPWKKEKSERADKLQEWLKTLSGLGFMLLPFMPQTAKIIINATEGSIKKAPPLFPKIISL